MKIFEKIKINLKNGKSRLIKIMGIPIIQYDKIDNKKTYYLPLLRKENIKKEKPIFYLKINRQEDYTFICLQHWIDVVSEMNNDYFILCDNEILKRNVYKKIIFPNSNIKFIKSNRGKYLQKLVKNIATKFWKKATFAHLTTFYHAKKNSFQNFWNIDADDTLFCMNIKTLVNHLKDIEKYADSNNIASFSLDMHRSRTNGIHWSFGITYTKMNIDWFKILEDNKDTSWQENYEKFDYEFNLDWFFTYLRDTKNIKNETFYINNSSFIHWGNFITNIIGSGIFRWQNNRLKFPIIQNIIYDEYFGNIPICKDCIKFEGNFTDSEYKNFIIENLTYLYKPSKQMLNMWKYNESDVKNLNNNSSNS